ILSAIDAAVPNPSIGIPGLGSWKPLNFLHDAINAAADGVQSALGGAQDAAARFQSGLLDSLTLLIGIPLLLALGVYDLFVLLLKHTLPALFNTATAPITSTATGVAARVTALEKTVASDLAAAKNYADNAAASALQTAKTYAATNIAAAAKSLEDDIKTVT